ncbi:MAG TPA: endonuclease domain-containing protein [Allosphingosinicella sp.]|jgi:very-short-patch-repair endonuclease
MLKNIAPKPRSGAVSQSRRLRRPMSLPEILLWRELRQRPAGLKFRRQHPSGAYTLDFYCNDARLAVEVDGEAHGRADRAEKDSARDSRLAGAGIATMRIPAIEVTHDVEAVVRAIVAQALNRLPPGHPAKRGSP